jgi:hypothetical protein
MVADPGAFETDLLRRSCQSETGVGEGHVGAAEFGERPLYDCPKLLGVGGV